jgi:hypothetical protein
MNDQTNTIKLFNGSKYYMKVRLYNVDGDEVIFNNDAINYLVIEDTLHFWPVRGYIIYSNPYESLEAKLASDTEIANSETLPAITETNLKSQKLYRFRNDGKDFLSITIRPELEGGEDLPVKTFPAEYWEMTYNCVIYDKEDIPASDKTQKMKKLFFWDADYQKMLDNTIAWSTATSKYNPNNKKASTATDSERELTTGLSIQSILEENGFSLDSKAFDKGSTKIFYTTFQDMNIWENIEYLLDQHMSEKTTATDKTPADLVDVCIFSKDRYTSKFELTPLYKFFERAGNNPDVPGDYQIEHLFFDDVGLGDGKESSCPFKAPASKTLSTTTDVKIDRIREYRFVDMSGGDNTYLLVTTPVHTYDSKNKTFSIMCSQSNVTELENKVKAFYINKKLLSKNGPHPLLTLNKDKIANKRIRPVYSIRSNKNAIMAKGLGKLLYTSLYLNQGINFHIDGATMRRAGRFIGIDKQTFSDNNFDYKICGQWFVLGVTHIFLDNMYKNEVTAVKIHSYEDLNLKKDV